MKLILTHSAFKPPGAKNWLDILKKEQQIMITHETGFKFHAQPQTGAYSCFPLKRVLKKQRQIKIDHETGFKFHAQPQTGAYSCYIYVECLLLCTSQHLRIFVSRLRIKNLKNFFCNYNATIIIFNIWPLHVQLYSQFCFFQPLLYST